MVQLRSCYFCGTTGALSEYEALPPALGVDEDETPRVILCDRCRTKLTNILAPLVESFDRSAVGTDTDRRPGRDSTAAAADLPSADAPTTDSTHEEPASAESDESPTQPEVTFSSSSTGTGSETSESADTIDRQTEVAGRSEEHGAETRERSEAVDSAEREKKRDDQPEAHAEADADADVEAEKDAEEQSTDLDRVYHKLLRFLRNREFPIPRAEAEAIAQSAYDLTASEASQVIQRTVDRDVLEERDGELHRS